MSKFSSKLIAAAIAASMIATPSFAAFFSRSGYSNTLPDAPVQSKTRFTGTSKGAWYLIYMSVNSLPQNGEIHQFPVSGPYKTESQCWQVYATIQQINHSTKTGYIDIYHAVCKQVEE